MQAPIRRLSLALALAACLAATQPVQAAGPLATIVLGYVKDAIKDAIVSKVRGAVTDALNERLADVPGIGILGMLVPELGIGVPGMGAPRLSKEASAALNASGLMDADAKPLTDKEWQEYERYVRTKVEVGEEEAAELAEMRAAMKDMPQMAGLVRSQLATFRELDQEQARMREAYAQMSEAERQEVAAETLKTIRELPAEEQAQARAAIDSPALGLPEDLRNRIRAAAAS